MHFFKTDSFITGEGDEAELTMLLLDRYVNTICIKLLVVFCVNGFHNESSARLGNALGKPLL